MGQAKRRKQLDPNYGKGFEKELERGKFVIELGNFINSSEVPNVTKGLQFKKSGIKDSGLCVAFAIKGFKLAGVAFPSVEGKGKICVGIITYSLDNDLSASEADKLTRTVRSAESEIRRVVAEAYKAKFYS
ncbi:MAG: hypothetical protein ICV86_16855 [Microcoleus sp. T3-bin5]|nr:hypothetical protein [Microcoleus sp. T3-bin5]